MSFTKSLDLETECEDLPDGTFFVKSAKVPCPRCGLRRALAAGDELSTRGAEVLINGLPCVCSLTLGAADSPQPAPPSTE